MSVVGVIQARASSTRLPGKVFAPLCGRPLLEALAKRLETAPLSELWLATSDGASDEVTAAWGRSIGLRVFRGSEDDVLSRFAAIVEESSPDWVVRFTADDPFTDSEVVRLLLEAAHAMDARGEVIGARPDTRELPLGYVPQVARAGAVARAHRELPVDSVHRTHVLSVLYSRGEDRPFVPPDSWPLRPDWRWTVDTAVDLEMAREAFELFGDHWPTIGYPQMVEILDHHPATPQINAQVRQKVVGEG